MQEEIPVKRKTTTSTAVKERYNQKTYRRYQLRIRYDDPLSEVLEAYEGSINELVHQLLAQHFKQK